LDVLLTLSPSLFPIKLMITLECDPF
jgi:hypothetical protein